MRQVTGRERAAVEASGMHRGRRQGLLAQATRPVVLPQFGWGVGS